MKVLCLGRLTASNNSWQGDVCITSLPYADVCCRMLPYAAVCCRMLPSAQHSRQGDVCIEGLIH
jgi:hypothetical protein